MSIFLYIRKFLEIDKKEAEIAFSGGSLYMQDVEEELSIKEDSIHVCLEGWRVLLLKSSDPKRQVTMQYRLCLLYI